MSNTSASGCVLVDVENDGDSQAETQLASMEDTPGGGDATASHTHIRIHIIENINKYILMHRRGRRGGRRGRGGRGGITNF